MNDLELLLKGLVLGLIAALVHWLLNLLPPPKNKKRRQQTRIPPENRIRHMPYNLPGKILATLSVPFVMLMLYGAAHAFKSGRYITILVVLLLIACTVSALYHVFFTHLSYDNDYLYYQSPLVGNKKVPWSNLCDVHSVNTEIQTARIIVIDGIGRIWCSNMRKGYKELVEFLEWKMEEIFPEE